MDGKVIVLIPSLNPDHRLVEYVEELEQVGLEDILIVDDGSGEECQPIFHMLEEKRGVTVLHHDRNRGKGRALKTGFGWCLANVPSCRGVVTADSDGQHSPQDTKKVAQCLLEGQDRLVLGSRDFHQQQVPFKSRYGNQITSLVFALLYGVWLRDTQTGLRGLGRKLLQPLCELPGEHFEYEIRMLIFAARKKFPIREVTIETIYIDGNRETHFRPVLDSMRIYGILFSCFFKYLLSSLSSSVIDMGLFSLFHLVVFSGMSIKANVFLSTLLARVSSSLYNFLVNRRLVFASTGSPFPRLASYYLLVVVQLICSAGLVCFFTDLLRAPAVPVKVVVDICLFLVSFQIQQRFIFRD